MTIVQTVVALASGAPEVVVYVDENGSPVSTATDAKLAATPSLLTLKPTATPAPAPAVAKVEASSSLTTTSAPIVSTTSSEAVPTASSPSFSGAAGFGYAYSPYNGDGGCKMAPDVLTDFSKFDSGVGLIRTYGTDCNTIAIVYPAVKLHNYKLFAGIYSLSDIAGQVKLIVDGVAGDWSSIDTISVGNELVDSKQADVGSVIAALKLAKTLLLAAGYTGPVVTVDTLQANLQHPELCDSSDYCAVNCHPFFDPNTPAEKAGSFITSSIATLKTKLANPSQKIVITETGWPTKGNSNSLAVPSPANQVAAISSIKAAFAADPGSVILLSPYNTMWKKSNAAQFNAEQFWGILGDCPSG